MPIKVYVQSNNRRFSLPLTNRTRIGKYRNVTFCDYKTAKDVMASIEAVDRPEFFKLFAIDPAEEGGERDVNFVQFY